MHTRRAISCGYFYTMVFLLREHAHKGKNSVFSTLLALNRACSFLKIPSDAVFPGFLEFPGIRKFPGIRPDFPGIPGNLKKAVFSPYLECSTVNLHVKHPF